MANLLSFFKFNLGEAAFYSIFGFVFVFAGIILLIAIFSGLGFAMKKINAWEKKPKKHKKGESVPAAPVFEESASDEVTPELIAVLTAAVAAAIEEEGGTCEFVVRRIKKL